MDTSEVKRGEEVAKSLGWTAGGRGAFGALGGLFDPDLLRFHRLVSYQRVLDGQQHAQAAQLRRALSMSADKAITEVTGRSRVG